MNLRELDRLDDKAIEQFVSLKRNISSDQNDPISIAKAEEAFNYIQEQLNSDSPNDIEVMDRLDFLATIGGISSYMKDFKAIIRRHLDLYTNY